MPDTGAVKLESPSGQPTDGADSYDPSLLSAYFASQRAALMSAPAPVIVFTAAGETVLINDVFRKATGFGPEHLPDIRACLLKVRRVPEADLETVLERWLQSHTVGFSKEITVWTAWDDRRVWLIHSNEPSLWPDGRTVIVQTIFDLTEQRRLEEALRRNQEEMRVRLAELELLHSSAPVGIAMLDADLKYVRVNKALADINGIPADAHIGRRVFDLLPQLRDPLEEPLNRVLTTGQHIANLQFEEEMAHDPGARRSWVEHIYPLRDSLGETIGLGVLVEEVTERRRVDNELASANVALRRTLDLLFLALRTAGVAVFTQDRELRYIWIGGDYFGCDPDASASLDDAAVLPPDLVEPMIALKQRVLDTGAPASADLPYQKEGRTAWCNVHLEPWRSQNGVAQSLIGAVSDVSERKATEQHIRNLLSELAHRSKNLLTVIQVMARRSVSPGLSSTDFVDSFIERLSGLAQSHDLLAREDWRGISMLELVTSQIGHLRNNVSDRLTIEGPDVVLTPVAAQNLGMALHELSTNAVKYGALSTATGRVSVTWSVFEDAEGHRRMRLSWVERGGPTVTEPTRRGFGRFVIEAIAARALSGSVDLKFEPEGVSCILEGAADSSVVADNPGSLAKTA